MNRTGETGSSFHASDFFVVLTALNKFEQFDCAELQAVDVAKAGCDRRAFVSQDGSSLVI